jgi:energy-coupling factor transport system ATP-binding protein
MSRHVSPRLQLEMSRDGTAARLHPDAPAQPAVEGASSARRTPGASATVRARIEQFVYEQGRPPVLRDVDLTVSTGELVVVAGASGSGKSTLALALAGIVPFRVEGELIGSVTWEEGATGGRSAELSDLPLHEAAQRVGMMFQNPEYQLIQYQVDAEVAFGPENLGLPHEEVVSRVHDSLEMVGAMSLASEPISSLSGGQKQRVAIAAMLAMAPRILVLDEPTSDLDPIGTNEVLRVLHRLSHELGHGVCIVEHKLDEVAPYADRVVLMDGGTIRLDEHPRRAFVPTSRWHEVGVRPPELVALSEALPRYFGDDVALSVPEAIRALACAPPPSSLCVPGVMASPPCATQPPVLEARDVVVSFKAKRVLGPASLAVREGEWVAVVGSNGSGKTTLASVLMGFVAPESGTATCFGDPVEFGKVPRQARHVGYLFQNVDDMLFSDSVDGELTFTARKGIDCGGDAPSLEEIAELIGLSDRLDAHPWELSGGERQRLGLGALLTRAPRAIILDEPTTGLDDVHATRLFELLARVRTSLGSLTCLLITHDMRLVARFADRVLALREGQVVLDTTPRRAFAQIELLESCGVRPPPVSVVHRLLSGEVTEVATHAYELATLVESSGEPLGSRERRVGLA